MQSQCKMNFILKAVGLVYFSYYFPPHQNTFNIDFQTILSLVNLRDDALVPLLENDYILENILFFEIYFIGKVYTRFFFQTIRISFVFDQYIIFLKTFSKIIHLWIKNKLKQQNFIFFNLKIATWHALQNKLTIRYVSTSL